MRLHRLSTAMFVAAISACSSDRATTAPKPPVPPVLLEDMEVSNLPSPYYHFDYDTAGRVSGASFASGFTSYEVSYDGGRIKDMRNNTIANHDRLEYIYDDSGRVAAVKYHDASNVVYTRLFFSYDGARLTGIERQRQVPTGYQTDKTVAFSYYPDGNLEEVVTHRPPFQAQQEATTVDRFEQYDGGINVDAFGLIHDDFFDHLVLLPGVQLQKGNPRRAIRSGDGINFEVAYSYAYDDRNRPLAKDGVMTVTNGTDAGRTFQLHTGFSY